MTIVDSLQDTVGQTSLLRLRRLPDPRGATVWAKCEQLNPTGSHKDRVAGAMLAHAKQMAALPDGATIVEATSGNFGIALVNACRRLGHPVVITMPESASLERRAYLRTCGAELVLTPADEQMRGARERADAIARERPGAVRLSQFDDPEAIAVHARTTAREIVDAFADGGPDAFVAGVGSGALLAGVSSVLRTERPNCRIVAVEPSAAPSLAEGTPGPTKILGLANGFTPPAWRRHMADEIVGVADAVAWATRQRLAREEGVLVGISSGACVATAMTLAASLDPSHNVVCILADTGERYFSMETYFPEAGA